MSTEIKLLLAWLITAIVTILIVTKVTEGGEIIKEPHLDSCEKWEVNENGNVIFICTIPKNTCLEFLHPASITAGENVDLVEGQTYKPQSDSRRIVRTTIEAKGRSVAYIIDRDATFFRKCGEPWLNAFTGEEVARECCR